jgi:hypothetical protein
MRNLTSGAYFVLAKMRTGAVLVGGISITEGLLGSGCPVLKPGKMFRIVSSKNYWIASESRSLRVVATVKRNIVRPDAAKRKA